MTIFMFQPRFWDGIRNGTKFTTIRAERKRFPHLGGKVSLRGWSDKPYRSKQIVLGESVLLNSQRIALVRMRHPCSHIALCIDGQNVEHFSPVSVNDGFDTVDDFMKWFQENHDIVNRDFHGTLYTWRTPITAPAPSS